MTAKLPVILLVLVETDRLGWCVAAIGPGGSATPLVRSDDGNLAKYQNLPFDDQVSFLRHRFCGVLQRGCDQLWKRDLKACQFAIVFEGLIPEPTGQLTQAAAEHFATWMLNPPAVVFHRADPATSEREKLAGEIPLQREAELFAGLGELKAAREDPEVWERVPNAG